MHKHNLGIFKDQLQHILEENILEYWLKNTIDEKQGGFVGQIDSNGVIDPSAPKGVILNTRILWTFSVAYQLLKDERYKVAADRAYTYITTYFNDKINGGVYWVLDAQGNPINKRKQIYAQAFAIYALSEYYKVTNSQQVMEWAKKLFYLIEKYSFDEVNNGYTEALTEDWSVLEDVRLSEKDMNEKKTMNTHLHVLEAYTNLYKIWPSKELALSLEKLIKLFFEKFINEKKHLNLFFNETWKLKSNVISFGHDIECSWLLHEAAEALQLPDLIKQAEDNALAMVDVLIHEGVDADGAIFNEFNPDTNHLDTNKDWWPQAEALVGFYNAFQISKNEKYIDSMLKVWSFINASVIDHNLGEWHWKVNRNGIPYKEEKVGLWKCPYHNARACIELITRMKN